METPSSYNLDALLPLVEQSITRAVRRMHASQHSDGGWGFQIEQSDLWGTVYALQFLHAAQEIPGLAAGTPAVNVPVVEMLARGISFLEQHPERWAAEWISPAGALSVYDISLLARCFYRLGRSFMRRESAQRVYRSIGRLYRSQNADGGWDANIWGYDIATPVRVWSEAGATSAAVMALVQTLDTRFQPVVEKSLRWLAATQNKDGSWNGGSAHPGGAAHQLSGQPAVNKTCDAVQAFLAAELLDLPLQPYRGCIERAVGWLLRADQHHHARREQAAARGIGFTHADYEQAALLLETLALFPLPDAFPNLRFALAGAASWLVATQRCQPGDPEDGSWVLGHTARIGLALTHYNCLARSGYSRQSIPWVH